MIEVYLVKSNLNLTIWVDLGVCDYIKICCLYYYVCTSQLLYDIFIRLIKTIVPCLWYQNYCALSMVLKLFQFKS
uniref:Uncharacterized protein LOC102669760 n=1 Tax=Rhizophora mucronata TaxID=61149 RepID=A0A2P2MV06_RHIMU